MKPSTLAALIVIASMLGCVERLAEDDEAPSYPACTSISATGYWHDGRVHVIFEEDTGTAGTACVCMTIDQIQSGELDHEVNDLAYAECTRLADSYSGNFDWDDCEERYLSGIWMAGIGFAWGDRAWTADGHDLDCTGDDTQGCSITGERSPGALPCLALLALLALRRRPPQLRSPSPRALM